MIWKRPLVGIGLLVISTLVAACAAQPATPVIEPTQPVTTASSTTEPGAAATNAAQEPDSSSDAGLARSDAQGAVEFVVKPLNLGAAGATLDFDVSMNTHSVDLGWDLAAQSLLTTNTGLEVMGQSWPVGSGHHYEGTLSFPVLTADGAPLLEGAATLTLTIRDTDVPERVFTWELEP